MPIGSLLVSRMAMTGMLSLRASWMAMSSLLVSITNIRSGMPPMSLMPPSESSSLSRSRVSWSSSFLVAAGALAAAALKHAFEFAQAGDGAGNRAPVGERAAQPAVVDVVLGAALGRDGHRVRRLALGADEQHATAAGRDFAHLDQRLVQQGHGLRKVDDVDVGAGAEDVAFHLRVPAVGLVAEVGAGFEKLPHGEFG